MSAASNLAFLQNNWMLILVFLASGGMLIWPHLQRRSGSVKELGTLEATRLMNGSNPVLLDIRETREYEGGRLAQALHIPLSQLESRGSELAPLKNRPILAYCERGNRSALAGKTLRKLGFTEVYSLRGGLAAWRQAGLPIAK